MTVAARHALVAVLTTAVTAVLVADPDDATAAARLGTAAAARPGGPATTVHVDAHRRGAVVPRAQLGVNHRWMYNGHHTWDTANDRPDPAAVRALRRARVSLLRYPGGTVANLFDWKDAIGSDRGCQTSGKRVGDGRFPATGSVFGPDEHMRLADAVGAQTMIMVPWATETPSDAADWVEYMNTPAGDGHNPNGGVDWAAVRAANGRPAPYRIRLWEVGNEQRTRNQRYWMSPDRSVAVRQYAYGGTATIRDEKLGRGCAHPKTGSRSTGQPHQTFQVLYPPATLLDDTVWVDGQRWTQVDRLDDAGPTDRVFVYDAVEGEVTFGDGEHGAVPGDGTAVTASYRSRHAGVFAFIAAMKRVDPTIKVCPTWGLPEFVPVAGRDRRYDCFSAHAYTNFRAERRRNWRRPVDGHDWHMVGTADEAAHIQKLRRALPAGTPIALTEFGAIGGDNRTYPRWKHSMTHATYMASMFAHWLRLGIPWATGDALTAVDYRGMLGPHPHWTFSAGALARRALGVLYDAGGRRVATAVTGNPVRRTRLRGRPSYPALAVAATHGRDRDLYLLVVNRLPAQAVRARIDLGRFPAGGWLVRYTVSGRSFASANFPGRTEVRLRRSTARFGRTGPVLRFAAASVSVLRLPDR